MADNPSICPCRDLVYCVDNWYQGENWEMKYRIIPGRMNIHLLQRMSFLSRRKCLQWMVYFLTSFTDSALPPSCSKCVTVLIGNKNLGNENSLRLGCGLSTGEYLPKFRTTLVVSPSEQAAGLVLWERQISWAMKFAHSVTNPARAGTSV